MRVAFRPLTAIRLAGSGEDMVVKAKTILCAFVLAVLARGRFADAEDFGDWTVDINNPTIFSVATVNDSDHVFGQFCSVDEGSCLWLMYLGIACKTGDTYPVLANSDTGAVYLELQCNGPIKEGGYIYAFTDFDQVENLVRKSKRVGFAFPMQEDEFQVVRFNLKGASAALSAMQEAAAEVSKPAPRTTRDQLL